MTTDHTTTGPTDSNEGLQGTAAVVARLALVLCGLVIGVPAADFALGFVEPPRLLGKRQLLPDGHPFGFHCYPTNPNGEFSPAPRPGRGWRLFDVTVPPTPVALERLRETPWCVRYQINEQGLRDKVYPPEPATGTIRILGIGDSFAMGEGVAEAESMFAQLTNVYSKSTAASKRTSIEVLNAGRSGFDTAREVRLLRQLAPKLRADRAIVVWLLNDIELSPKLRHEQRWINDLINVREAQLWRDTDRPWWHRSRLLRWVDAWWRMRAITAQTVDGYRRAWSRHHNGANVARFAERLRQLGEMQNPRVVLVLYPMLVGLEDYPFAAIHQRVAEVAAGVGLPVLDLAPIFAGMDPSKLHVHPTDHHPNGRAHAIAAKAIGEWLPTVDGFL